MQGVLGQGHEVHTAANGSDALRLLNQHPFDVVVSDLAMPGMDGMEFLNEVVEDFPHTARVIVSGYADRLKIAECLTVGHRFFHKPIDFKTLATFLRRVCKYSHLVSNDRLRKIICGTKALPALPENYLRLSEILSSPFSDLDEIIELVEQDPGLSTKLLHVANSATFAPAQPICTPAEAVQSTGVDIIKALMLVHQVFTFYENNSFATETFKSLWSHSLATATAARKLATLEEFTTPQIDECFLAGLLHDIGKLILAANAEREYRVVVELAAKASLPLDQAEMGVFAATHAQVGAYLLALWGVPENVISAVELHQSLDPDRVKKFDPALAVHLAQNLEPGGARKKFLNTALLDQLGLSARLPVWESAIAELGRGNES